jgi:predicted transcriptional regulator
LWEEEGLTQKEISHRVYRGETKRGWPEPSISRVLDILAKKELITREIRERKRMLNKVFYNFG